MRDRAIHGALHRQFAPAKFKVLASSIGMRIKDKAYHELVDVRLRLGNDVLARDPEVDVTLADVRGNVRGREEDERHRQGRALRNIEAVGLEVEG